MTYFDSPKNQAIWDKEIARMETERERRRQNGFKPDSRSMETREDKRSGYGEKESPLVRLITLEELEEIVRMQKGNSSKGRQKDVMHGRSRESYVNERNGYVREVDIENAHYGTASRGR